MKLYGFIYSQPGTYFYYSAKGQSQQRKLPFANTATSILPKGTRGDIYILYKITTEHNAESKALQII